MLTATRLFRSGWGRWCRAGSALGLLLSALSPLPTRAQNITQAEYYLDGGPGNGTAVAVPIASPAPNLSNLSFGVNLSSLAAGFHSLTVRSKDATGHWSLATRRTFYYEPLGAAALPNITRAEYYVDTDPGFGSGTSVPLTANSTISSLTFSVNVSSYGAGFHTLGLRTRDANGVWSLTTRRTFYYEPLAAAALPNITRAEYYVDNDPGFGSATSVPLTAAADISGLAFSVNVSSYGAGFHTLGLRTRDANGKWSLTTRRTFYYEPAAVAAPNLNRVEYFVDNDPGFGSGVNVPITAGIQATPSFTVNLSSLTAGFHAISVRSRDANGRWSLTHVRTFYYEPAAVAAPNLTRVEYYFDTDPGFGSATNVPFTATAELSNFSLAADASALADGSHRLFVRVRDANGKWSLVTNRPFFKNGCGSSLNAAADLPAASYTAYSYYGTPQAAFQPTTGSYNTIVYNGGYVQADLSSAQTVGEVRLTLRPQSNTNVQVQVQTSTNLTSWTTAATYTGTLAGDGAKTYALTMTLPTPAANVRGIRLVPTSSVNALDFSAVGVYYFNCAGPAITSFTPTGGAGGTVVDIVGTNLSGATAVTFNGVAADVATITNNTSTGLRVTAPASGTSGQICVTTSSGTGCSSGNYTYPPTIVLGTVSPQAFCSNTYLAVPFTTNMAAFGAGNQFRFQLSDASGNFTDGSRLYGTLSTQNANGGVLTDTVAFRTPAGTGYRVRVVSTNPAVTSASNAQNLTVYAMPAATASAVQTTVPYNGTIQLTAGPTGQSSYQWYVRYTSGGTSYVGSGRTLSVANAQPTQSGRYFVYVGSANSCQDSASVRVTVQANAVPILAMSTFSGAYCGGTSFSIGFTVTGNAFAAGNTISAQLSNASGSFATPTTIGSVSFSGQGSGVVVATVPTSTGSGAGYRIRLVGSSPAITSQADNGANLTFTQQPTASASSNSPVAYNGTLQLSAAAVTGATYQWYGPNGFFSSQQNPSLANATPANSGNYSLYVTVNSCQSLAATIAVTVNPNPQPILTVSALSGSFCSAANLNLGFSVTGNSFAAGNTISAQLSNASGSFASPTTVGAVSFSGLGSGSVSVTLPLNTPAGTGYRLRLVGSNPATTSQNDNGSNLTINPAPVAVPSSNSPVTAGGTIQLSAQTVSGATYVWSGPNGFSSSLQNPSIAAATAANEGTYTLTVTLGSCTAKATTAVTVTAVQTTAAVTTGTVSGSFCPGSALSIPFSTTGTFAGGNQFRAVLSNASGSFASGTQVLGSLSLSGTAPAGAIAGTIPTGTAAGSAYRIRVESTNPAVVSSNNNGQNLTVGSLTFTWTGGYDANWFDGRNWSCGVVPTSTSVVIIPGGMSIYPNVAGGTALALNLTVQTGATLSFGTGGNFTLYGNVVYNGTCYASRTSTWTFAGSGVQTVSGSAPLQFGSVVINSGAILRAQNVLCVYGSWTNNGGFQNGGSSYGVVFNGPAGFTQVIGGSVSTSFYNLTIEGTTTVSLGIGIAVAGNLVTDGIFSAAGYGLVLDGTVAQTIGGTGTTTFYGITINNTVGVTLASDIRVLGDWINNGQFAAGSYSVVFAGTVVQYIGGTQVTRFYDLTLQNALSVTLRQNIYVLGGFVNTGVFYGYYTSGSITTGYWVRFGGTVAQVINVNSTSYFWHFYADNAAGLSLASNLYVAGNFYLYSGSFAPGTYTVYFNGASGTVQTVGGYAGLSFYGWNIAGGATVRLLQHVTLLGNFVNAGTFYGYNLVGSTYTGYTFGWAGTGAQVLSGTGRTEFWHVTWNNAVSVTLQQNIYVLGNWLNTQGFAAGTYTVYFNGTLAQTIGGAVNTTFYHISVGNTVGVTLNQRIDVLGNWLGTGTFLAGTYPVYFRGSTAQTISTGAATRFYHLYFDNPTTVTLLSNLYLRGNWVNDRGFVAGTYGVYFTGTSLQTIGGASLTQFYHLTIAALASVRLDRALTVLGNWTTNGDFLANGYVVTFAGTLNQVVGGTVVVPFYGVIINNTTGGVTLAQDIRIVGGNWVNNGVFAPATFRVIFDGTVAQLIGGSATTTFYGLTILNNVGVSLSGPVFIRGNLVNDGVFSCAGYLVTFNGTTAQSIGGTQVTVFGDVTFNNAVGVSLLQDVRVRGNWRNLAVFAAGARTVYFDGSVAQAIYCPSGTLTFHHVVFSNLLGVTLQDNIFLTGNWVNNGGFAAGGKLVTFSGNTLQTIGGTVATVFHHLTLASGASVRLDRAITLLGNWLNNGATFAANAFTVFFNGTVAQTIGGTALTVFHHLTLNNTVGVSLAFDADLTGNFVNNGKFCGCGYRTRFLGTAPQSITCTSGQTRFHHLTFANTTGVTLLDNIGVTGNWVNNGGFVANGYLVLFSGTALQTIGGTVLSAFHHVQVTNAVNVQLLRDITVAGYWLNSGIFSGNGFGVTFLGTVQQVITTTGAAARTTFHHVTWANAVGCLLAGDVYVTGNWLCNGPFNPATYTVYFTGTVAQAMGGSATLRFHSLTVQNTVGLTCNGPVYLYGNLTNGGLVNVGTYPWYCVGTSAQTLGGTTSTPIRFYDLLVQNGTGVGCTSSLGVAHVLTLTTGNLASDGHLTLHSNAAGTAMVVNPVSGGVVTGRATMERFISSTAPGYRHYSSPMQLGTAKVSEFQDDLPVFELNPAYNTIGNKAKPFPTVFFYHEPRLTSTASAFTAGWQVPTSSDNLVPGQGFSLMTDPTTVVDISGELSNGNQRRTLERSSLGQGWNLAGNPYPAPIDWDEVRSRGMLSGVDDALYVFVPSGKYTGAYRSYVNGVSQNGGSKDLAAMQGFFVRASSGSAALNFTNAARLTTYANPAYQRGTAERRPVVRLEARNAQGQADEAVFYLQPQASALFDAAYDALKVTQNGAGRPTLWSQAANERLAINALPGLPGTAIPLGVRASQPGEHTLVLTSHLNLPAGTPVVLEDRLLNRRQNLTVDSVYRFSLQPDSVRQRFYLWLGSAVTATPAASLEAATQLFPNPTTTGLATLRLVGLSDTAPVTGEMLNSIGQVVQQLTLRPRQGIAEQQLDLRALPTGVYLVRLHTATGYVVKRLVKD